MIYRLLIGLPLAASVTAGIFLIVMNYYTSQRMILIGPPPGEYSCIETIGETRCVAAPEGTKWEQYGLRARGYLVFFERDVGFWDCASQELWLAMLDDLELRRFYGLDLEQEQASGRNVRPRQREVIAVGDVSSKPTGAPSPSAGQLFAVRYFRIGELIVWDDAQSPEGVGCPQFSPWRSEN